MKKCPLIAPRVFNFRGQILRNSYTHSSLSSLGISNGQFRIQFLIIYLLFYNLFHELDLPIAFQINWAWTSFIIIQNSMLIFFLKLFMIFKNLYQEKILQMKMWMRIQLVKMLERWTKTLKKSRRLFGMKWRKCHHFKQFNPFSK